MIPGTLDRTGSPKNVAPLPPLPSLAIDSSPAPLPSYCPSSGSEWGREYLLAREDEGRCEEVTVMVEDGEDGRGGRSGSGWGERYAGGELKSTRVRG
jgi:hypothetical protein